MLKVHANLLRRHREDIIRASVLGKEPPPPSPWKFVAHGPSLSKEGRRETPFSSTTTDAWETLGKYRDHVFGGVGSDPPEESSTSEWLIAVGMRSTMLVMEVCRSDPAIFKMSQICLELIRFHLAEGLRDKVLSLVSISGLIDYGPLFSYVTDVVIPYIQRPFEVHAAEESAFEIGKLDFMSFGSGVGDTLKSSMFKKLMVIVRGFFDTQFFKGMDETSRIYYHATKDRVFSLANDAGYLVYIMEFISSCLTNISRYTKSGDYADLLGTPDYVVYSEEANAYCEAHRKYKKGGIQGGYDIKEALLVGEELVTRGSRLLNGSSGKETLRPIFTNVLSVVKDLARANDPSRPEPYAIFLAGPPGTGKTTIAMALADVVYAAEGLPPGNYCHFYNLGVKHQTVEGPVRVLVLNDVGSIKDDYLPETDYVSLFQTFADSSPLQFSRASIEDKNNSYEAPSMVVATTNSSGIYCVKSSEANKLNRRYRVVKLQYTSKLAEFARELGIPVDLVLRDHKEQKGWIKYTLGQMKSDPDMIKMEVDPNLPIEVFWHSKDLIYKISHEFTSHTARALKKHAEREAIPRCKFGIELPHAGDSSECKCGAGGEKFPTIEEPVVYDMPTAKEKKKKRYGGLEGPLTRPPGRQESSLEAHGNVWWSAGDPHTDALIYWFALSFSCSAVLTMCLCWWRDRAPLPRRPVCMRHPTCFNPIYYPFARGVNNFWPPCEVHDHRNRLPADRVVVHASEWEVAAPPPPVEEDQSPPPEWKDWIIQGARWVYDTYADSTTGWLLLALCWATGATILPFFYWWHLVAIQRHAAVHRRAEARNLFGGVMCSLLMDKWIVPAAFMGVSWYVTGGNVLPDGTPASERAVSLALEGGQHALKIAKDKLVAAIRPKIKIVALSAAGLTAACIIFALLSSAVSKFAAHGTIFGTPGNIPEENKPVIPAKAGLCFSKKTGLDGPQVGTITRGPLSLKCFAVAEKIVLVPKHFLYNISSYTTAPLKINDKITGRIGNSDFEWHYDPQWVVEVGEDALLLFVPGLRFRESFSVNWHNDPAYQGSGWVKKLPFAVEAHKYLEYSFRAPKGASPPVGRGDCGTPLLTADGSVVGIYGGATDMYLYFSRVDPIQVEKGIAYFVAEFLAVHALTDDLPLVDKEVKSIQPGLHPSSDAAWLFKEGRMPWATVGYVKLDATTKLAGGPTSWCRHFSDRVEPHQTPKMGKAWLSPSGEWTSPFVKKMKSLTSIGGSYKKDVMDKALDMALEDVSYTGPPVGFISLHQAIAGDRANAYINGRDTTKGIGGMLRSLGVTNESAVTQDPDTFVYTVHPALLRMVEEKLQKLKLGQYVTRVEAVVKDECLPSSKVEEGKGRFFFVHCLADNLIMRMAMLNIITHILKNPKEHGCYAGINAAGPDWAELLSHLTWGTGEGLLLETDQEGYDSHHNLLFSPYAEYILRVGRVLGYSPDELTILRNILLSMGNNLVLMMGGLYVDTVGTSGRADTVIMNSVKHKLMYYYALADWYFVKGERVPEGIQKELRLALLGDDSLASRTPKIPWFTGQYLREVCLSLGYVITAASKDGREIFEVPVSEATFLKRGFRREGACVYAPLAEKSIYRSLAYWVPGGVPEVERNLAACRTAQIEFFFHGRERFDRFQVELDNLTKEVGLAIPRLDYHDLLRKHGEGDLEIWG